MTYRRSLAAAVLLLGVTVGHAADRFVSTTGNDAGGASPCTSAGSPCLTIGQALSQAASGDVIKIAKGTYKESLHITTAGTRTFQGGWDPAFTTHDPLANKTIWKGAKNDRALDIEAFGIGVTAIFETINLSKSKFPKGSFEPGAAIQAFSADGFSPPNAQGSLTIEIHDSTVSSNRSDAGGGAIELQQNDSSIMTLTVTNSTFASNVAEFRGGAMEVLCTNKPGTLNVNISDSTFAKNNATSAGSGVGGALVFDSVCNTSNITLTNDHFQANGSNGKGTADSGGAALRVTSEFGTPVVTLQNDAFEGNKSKANGGAIAALASLSGSITLYSRNSTIANKNSAVGDGGGVWLSGNVTADFLDDVIWGNAVGKTGVGDDLATAGAPTVTLARSDLHDKALSGTTTFNDGGGNIDADPGFAKKSFSPAPGSPLIDAGTCSAPGGTPAVLPFDFFHHPRPDPAAGDPSKCDIGAVEF